MRCNIQEHVFTLLLIFDIHSNLYCKLSHVSFIVVVTSFIIEYFNDKIHLYYSYSI